MPAAVRRTSRAPDTFFRFALALEASWELRGQTEAAVDLTRLAGLNPAGVICEIVNDDGTMARVPHLVQFCKIHSLVMITVADLARYRLESDHEGSKRAWVELWCNLQAKSGRILKAEMITQRIRISAPFSGTNWAACSYWRCS